MVTVHFTDNFAAVAEENVTAWKNAGTDPADALRDLEKLCAKSGEEFHPDGTPLVEKIYDGKFDGGQALNFIPNAARDQVSTKTPISGTVANTPTSINAGVDAKAVSATPDSHLTKPTSDDIARKAASTTTPIAPEAAATTTPTNLPGEPK